MKNIDTFLVYSLLLMSFLISNTGASAYDASKNSDSTTNKDVYNFTSSNGTPVFTDLKPKSRTYKTQTIKTTKVSVAAPEKSWNQQPSTINNIQVINNNTVIINQYQSKKTKKNKTKNKCKSYRKHLDRVMKKMNAGYLPSEYKKLEKKRLKYRNLIFKRCDSRLQ